MSLHFGPTVVEGEAPETDSEDETPANVQEITAPNVESDNELDGSISSAISAANAHIETSNSVQSFKSVDDKVETLLLRKLYECNKTLHNSVKSSVHNVARERNKKLSMVNQQLLQSQVALQSAVNSLRSLNQSAVIIRNKMNDILSSNFFNNIKNPHDAA